VGIERCLQSALLERMRNLLVGKHDDATGERRLNADDETVFSPVGVGVAELHPIADPRRLRVSEPVAQDELTQPQGAIDPHAADMLAGSVEG
jgi:hypothetical protein